MTCNIIAPSILNYSVLIETNYQDKSNEAGSEIGTPLLVSTPFPFNWITRFDNFLLCVSLPSDSHLEFIIWPGNLESLLDFLPAALLSSHRDAFDYFLTTSLPTPRRGTKVSIGPNAWTCSLSVAWFIDKQPQLQFLLLLALTKTLKTQNCQDGMVHSIWLKQLSAHSPRQKMLYCQKQWLNPSVPKLGRPGLPCQLRKLGPSTVSPSLTSSCSLCSSGWELRGSWCCRPNNFRNSSQQTGIGGLKTNLHMHFYFQSLFMHSNKKMKRVTEMKINRLIYLLALNSLSYCWFETGESISPDRRIWERSGP